MGEGLDVGGLYGGGAGCRWVIWGRGLDVGGLYGGGGWM